MIRLKALTWRELRWRWANRRVPAAPPTSRPEFASQYGQDAFVVTLFNGMRDGVFVDIGANDGVSLSNTFHLERELGWSGLLVEPHAEAFAELTQRRSSHAVNACAADHDGVVRFAQIEGSVGNMLSGVLSTFTPAHTRRIERQLKKAGGELREVEAPAVRIDRVLQEQGVERVDYLSIDTEGGELAIVDSIDLQRWRVGCVGMENNGRSLAVRRRMAERGYRLAAVLGCDEMFVRDEFLRAGASPRAAA